MSLEATGGPAANETTVDKEMIGLVGRDEERRPRRDLVHGKYLPEKRIAIVDIPVGGIGPNPKGIHKPGWQIGRFYGK